MNLHSVSRVPRKDRRRAKKVRKSAFSEMFSKKSWFEVMIWSPRRILGCTCWVSKSHQMLSSLFLFKTDKIKSLCKQFCFVQAEVGVEGGGESEGRGWCWGVRGEGWGSGVRVGLRGQGWGSGWSLSVRGWGVGLRVEGRGEAGVVRVVN